MCPIYVSKYTCVHLCLCVPEGVSVYMCMCISVYLFVSCVCRCLYASVQCVSVCVHMFVCLCACAHLCVFECVCLSVGACLGVMQEPMPTHSRGQCFCLGTSP